MKDILSEKEYQHFIMDRLSQDNGYIVRKATSYDRFFAIDREMLFRFLNDTQPDEMASLRKIYKGDLEDTIVSALVTVFYNDAVELSNGEMLGVYVINPKTKKFHYPWCYSALEIGPDRIYIHAAPSELAEKYNPCGRCKPQVSGEE